MHADRIGSHFSYNGPINFHSRPDCYICKDASVDTHINGPAFGINLVYGNINYFRGMADLPHPIHGKFHGGLVLKVSLGLPGSEIYDFYPIFFKLKILGANGC